MFFNRDSITAYRNDVLYGKSIILLEDNSKDKNIIDYLLNIWLNSVTNISYSNGKLSLLSKVLDGGLEICGTSNIPYHLFYEKGFDPTTIYLLRYPQKMRSYKIEKLLTCEESINMYDQPRILTEFKVKDFISEDIIDAGLKCVSYRMRNNECIVNNDSEEGIVYYE